MDKTRIFPHSFFRSRRKNKNSSYSKLRFKILMQTSGMVALTFLIIFILYSRFWFGRMGDWIVGFLQGALHLDYEDAWNIYNYGLRENSHLIMFGAVAVCFLLLFRILLTRFTRYFNEIDQGLDKLIQGNDKEILLSSEMEPMERKLNVLRQTLEKRELEAKLAEERKNNLVMYLAHDIRTPLTSVIGYLSLLEEAPDMPPEQKAKYVHITLEKANRLEGLIQEFFEITRYNIQQIRLDKEWIDLYYMLVQMMEEFYPLLAEKGNHAALHSPENIKLYADPIKLARVFNNILKNAIAYSAPNTPISIRVEELPTPGLNAQKPAQENTHPEKPAQENLPSEKAAQENTHPEKPSQEDVPSGKPVQKDMHPEKLSQEDVPSGKPVQKDMHPEKPSQEDVPSGKPVQKDMHPGKTYKENTPSVEIGTVGTDPEGTSTEDRKIRISFRNQGRTIPPDKLTAIFDKFYRMDEARNSNTGGAGLGLAIAREIVTLHGGKIYATSENGEVIFSVELPQATEQV